MTNDELTKQFEDGIRQLDETEARRFLSARHFGKCLDCGKQIFPSGCRKRCDVCQQKRNHENMMAFKRKANRRDYKSTNYQKIVGRSVGR